MTQQWELIQHAATSIWVVTVAREREREPEPEPECARLTVLPTWVKIAALEQELVLLDALLA